MKRVALLTLVNIVTRFAYQLKHKICFYFRKPLEAISILVLFALRISL